MRVIQLSPLASGFDRNQPVRRHLDTQEEEPTVEYADAGMACFWDGRKINRRASLEGWIAECEEHFPGDGVRDFWEIVWNVSVYSWDFIDYFHKEPWRSPHPGFPFTNPWFWRGARRTRLIFRNTLDQLNTFHFAEREKFYDFLDAQVRLQYGQGLRELPFGMTALALNAPSESYRYDPRCFQRIAIELTKHLPDAGLKLPHSPCWHLGLATENRELVAAMPVCQFFNPNSGHGLPDSYLLVWNYSSADDADGTIAGSLYFRAEQKSLTPELMSQIQSLLTNSLGAGWGGISSGEAEALLALRRADGVVFEPELPWLGLPRLMSCRRMASARTTHA